MSNIIISKSKKPARDIRTLHIKKSFHSPRKSKNYKHHAPNTTRFVNQNGQHRGEKQLGHNSDMTTPPLSMMDAAVRGNFSEKLEAMRAL